MRWKADKEIQPDKTVHVWPESEEMEHVLHGTSCECSPRLQMINGFQLVIHDSYADLAKLKQAKKVLRRK